MALFSELQLTWREGPFNWDHFKHFAYIRESAGNNETVERAIFNYHTASHTLSIISRFLCCVVFLVQKIIHEWAIDDKLFRFKINNSRMFNNYKEAGGVYKTTRKFLIKFLCKKNFFNLSHLSSQSTQFIYFYFLRIIKFLCNAHKKNTINCVKKREEVKLEYQWILCFNCMPIFLSLSFINQHRKNCSTGKSS